MVYGIPARIHCVKSVRIRRYSDPHFPTFGLNSERYSVQMWENTDQNNSEYGHFLRSDSFMVQSNAFAFAFENNKILFVKKNHCS